MMRFLRRAKDTTSYSGVVTFFNSFNAMKAEKTLRVDRIPSRLIHSPRELSPTCGVALAVRYGDRDVIETLFRERQVEFDGIFEFDQ